MSARRSRLVPVLLGAVLLVGAANLGAFAATGGPLLLGKGNTASKTTKLKTTGNGAALALKSKAGKAPLKVSNSTKVTKLNADLVDGLDGASLMTTPYVYHLSATSVAAATAAFPITGLPSGDYLVTVNITAKVNGGSSTFFGCYFTTADGAPSLPFQLQFLGVTDGSSWTVTGSGLLDATVPQRLLCSRNGGTSMTVPSSSFYSAQVSFTRVDAVTRTASPGGPLVRSSGDGRP